VISGWVKGRQSSANLGASEDVLQTKIILGIDYGTAANWPKPDGDRFSPSGNLSPNPAVGLCPYSDRPIEPRYKNNKSTKPITRLTANLVSIHCCK
jgi:hypothetical protein